MRLQLSVLQKLAEHGATTLLLSGRRSRRIGIVVGNPANDASIRLCQALRVVDTDYCRRSSAALVAAKIRRQSRACAIWLVARPDRRRILLQAHRKLHRLAQEVGAQPTVEGIRGVEGAAARQYFVALRSVVPPELEFTGRNRRPPRDPVNAALSLAYTLLHWEAVHVLHAVGLDPMLGFYHRPSFGRESLACDVMEPLRPAVDRWIWRLFADR